MMDLSVSLPWWAIAYLVVFFGLTFAEAFMDVKERPIALVGDLLSFLFAATCVFSYFDAEIAAKIGFLLAPMIILGLGWEFTQSVNAANRAENEMKQERDITDNERSVLLNIGIGFGALIVLPAYMMGLIVCYDLARGMF